jgi:predicted peroxiredoxin
VGPGRPHREYQPKHTLRHAAALAWTDALTLEREEAVVERLKIIIRDDNYMRIQAPLSFAYDFAQRGVRVDVLFLNLAVRVLTPAGAESLTVDGRHAEEEPWFRERLAAVGVPPDTRDWLREITKAGKVTLNACRDSAEVLQVTEADLIPEAAGMVDSSEFIQDAVDTGVHCMYF